MKIIFIMPAVGKKENGEYIASWKMEPLSLAVLAGLTPSDTEVKFFDDRFDEINFEEGADLVAINVETYTAKRAYEISLQFRRRKIPVILGGFHPTLFPYEAVQYADSIVIGEAEDIWHLVVNDAARGRLSKYYQSDARPVLNGIKPRRQIITNRRYLPVSLVESARGCRYACDFCSVSSFYGSSYNKRPIKEIIAEIESLGKKTIFLVDDNITADAKRAKELFSALAPLKTSWFSQGSIDMANDVKLLSLMKKSGCLGLLIGFESLNKSNLASMNKKWNLGGQNYEEAVKKIRSCGIVMYATFIFGYDYDTIDSFDAALEFALKQKFFLAAFNHLVPFPGTPLYAYFEKGGRLLYDKWWLEPSYRFGDVAFMPKQMSPKQLSEGCMRLRKEFYSFNSIFKRAVDVKANCLSPYNAMQFFLLNLFSQGEVRRRQGLEIGTGIDF